MTDIEDYQVKNNQIEKILKKIGHKIGDLLPQGWGFTLLIFNFGEKGNLFYISNAKREDMIKTMQEFIDKNKKNGNN